MSLQGVEKILVGCGAFEEGIAKARIEAANAQVTSAHCAELPSNIAQFGVAQVRKAEIRLREVCPDQVCPAKVGAPEIHPIEGRATEVRTAQICLAEIRRA